MRTLPREHRPTAARAVFWALLAIGLLMVVSGWAIQGSGYLPGLLLQVGASIDLVAPLFLLNGYLERKLRRTERNTENIANSVNELRASVQQTAVRLNELGSLVEGRRVGRLDAVTVLADRVSRHIVCRALAQVLSVGAIGPEGIRVRLPDAEHWLRFQSVPPVTDGTGPDVVVALEDLGARCAVPLQWAADDGPDVFITDAAALLERQGDRVGAAGLDGAALFARLSHDLLQAVDLSRRPEGTATGGVYEVVNDQWAVAANGLVAMNTGYVLPRRRLMALREDWVGHLSRKDWVHPAKFKEALRVARALFSTV